MILGKGFFVTPSDSVAVIAANAQEAIPYFKNGPKVWNSHASFLKNFSCGVDGFFKGFCTMNCKNSWTVLSLFKRK